MHLLRDCPESTQMLFACDTKFVLYIIVSVSLACVRAPEHARIVNPVHRVNDFALTQEVAGY